MVKMGNMRGFMSYFKQKWGNWVEGSDMVKFISNKYITYPTLDDIINDEKNENKCGMYTYSLNGVVLSSIKLTQFGYINDR